jgi:hypothetical protein
MKSASCTVDVMRLDRYQCFLQLRKITVTDPTTNQYSNFVLVISFLSSGSDIRTRELSGDFGAADTISKFNLPTGGYLLMYKKAVKDTGPGRLLIDGEIFDNDDVLYSSWDIPDNLTIPFPYAVIYDNFGRTFEIISEITPTTFTIISSYYPRFNNMDSKFNYI